MASAARRLRKRRAMLASFAVRRAAHHVIRFAIGAHVAGRAAACGRAGKSDRSIERRALRSPL
ncbi:hypothetical protein CA830_04305 [Burkholderia multivorans]|nr:hypothetical protein CA831_05005 [Burkholderia multivorans]OXH93987.1 hypothetical protein CA830_04305 [Burkholderia multivorans]